MLFLYLFITYFNYPNAIDINCLYLILIWKGKAYICLQVLLMKKIVFVHQNNINQWIFERVCYALNEQVSIRCFDSSKEALHYIVTETPDYVFIEDEAHPYTASQVVNQLAEAGVTVSVVVMVLYNSITIKSYYHNFALVVDVVEFPADIHWISRYVTKSLTPSEVK